MQTFTRVRRNRGPALAWTPTQDSYYELAQKLRSQGRLPLYLTQAAILEFEAHLRESSLPLPFGLLAGDVCICPQTKIEYLLVDTVSRARVELDGDDPYAQLAEELQSLASEQSRNRKVAIGWYLGGLADDLTLDDDVTRLHEQLFPERWQLALVRGSASGTERGAFLRYESIWSRWYSIPFFESLPERAGQKKGERRTAIRWENYRADEPARPFDESEVGIRSVSTTPRPSWGARLFGASLEPLRRAAHGTPGRVAERTRATSAASVEEKVRAPRELRVAPTPELKVASAADLQLAAPAEVKRVLPAETRVAARVAPTAPQAPARFAREEPNPEVLRIFIDGHLVPAPLAPEPSRKPAMSSGSDRASVSPVVVGTLLLLIPVLLYFVAS